jgi:spore coat polysaccharide biosynthesis predicted glycosyltransferase SpsG
LGHLARCTALACALSAKGFELQTLGLGAEEAVEIDGVRWGPWQPDAPVSDPAPDLLVLDTYDRVDWQRVAAQPHGHLVSFEDALLDPGAADVVISPEDGSEPGGRVLAGLSFACLRRPFWDLEARQIRETPQRVLITTGGGDLDGLGSRLAEHLYERLSGIEIELVWGPGFGGKPPEGVTVLNRPPSLLEPLLRADAVVCTGGQTMLEAAATGTPALVIEGAPNQRAQIASLAAREAIVPIDEEEAPANLERLLGSASLRRQLSTRAQQAIDGRGALRIAAELETLARA